jgi:competence protein ComEC
MGREPGAIGRMAAFGIGPLIAASLGVILMGLLRTPLRWSGAFVLALGVVWAVAARQPDILISGDGHNVAVRGRDGRLHLMRTGKDAFLVKEWLAGDADNMSAADTSLSDGVSCDETGCVVPMADGSLVAQALRVDALADDCARALLIVTAKQAPRSCAAAVIDQGRLRRQGTLVLWRRGNEFAADATKSRGFDRPWSPAAPGDADGDVALVARPAAPRAQDATPSETDLQSED